MSTTSGTPVSRVRCRRASLTGVSTPPVQARRRLARPPSVNRCEQVSHARSRLISMAEPPTAAGHASTAAATGGATPPYLSCAFLVEKAKYEEDAHGRECRTPSSRRSRGSSELCSVFEPLGLGTDATSVSLAPSAAMLEGTWVGDRLGEQRGEAGDVTAS